MKKILFYSLFALFSAPNMTKATESFDFIGDVIHSLQSTQIAEERMRQSNSNSFISQMKDIMLFNYGILEAADFIKPHLKSSNEIINKSADSLYFIYSSVVKNNENLLDTFENSLNNKKDMTSMEGTFFAKNQ